MTHKNLLPLWFLFLFSAGVSGQETSQPLPRIIKQNNRYALLVDNQPYFILGGQVHNSSGWPAMLPNVWEAVSYLHANTLEIPVYWEQIEPEPGKFDFSIVNSLLLQARQHQTRLVLLWFGTWKNGSNHYMPGWMKRDAAKYPNVTGRKGQPIDSPSPHAKATLNADINAFTALMTYLKQADPQRTVIMMQVENEPGTWDSVRDYSPEAQKLFEEPVPAAMLSPELLKALNIPATKSGSWQAVFGDRADEYFHAWHVASYIGQVAAAGKKVYPLPMYANAALRDPLTNPPATNYESGGATDNVIPIWKAAAPALDLVAPDVYLEGSNRVLKVLDLYNRPDNALFVPEIGLKPVNAKYLYSVMAGNGIGFAPFGIDNNSIDTAANLPDQQLSLYTQAYRLALPMIRQLAQWGFEGKIKSAVEQEDHAAQTINVSAWEAVVKFGEREGGTLHANAQPDGKLMIVSLGENEFLLMGNLCNVTFRPLKAHANRAWQYLKVEEGNYKNGIFVPLRIWNGDETDWGGPQWSKHPTLLWVTLAVR